MYNFVAEKHLVVDFRLTSSKRCRCLDRSITSQYRPQTSSGSGLINIHERLLQLELQFRVDDFSVSETADPRIREEQFLTLIYVENVRVSGLGLGLGIDDAT